MNVTEITTAIENNQTVHFSNETVDVYVLKISSTKYAVKIDDIENDAPETVEYKHIMFVMKSIEKFMNMNVEVI